MKMNTFNIEKEKHRNNGECYCTNCKNYIDWHEVVNSNGKNSPDGKCDDFIYCSICKMDKLLDTATYNQNGDLWEHNEKHKFY